MDTKVFECPAGLLLSLLARIKTPTLASLLVLAAARCFDAAGVILPGLETTHEARGVVCIQSGVLARRCKVGDQNKQKSRGAEYITQGGADGV